MWSSRAKVSKTPHQHGARLPIHTFSLYATKSPLLLTVLLLTLIWFQEESKALTIKEKLKKKMQQQLKKTFKVLSLSSSDQ